MAFYNPSEAESAVDVNENEVSPFPVLEVAVVGIAAVIILGVATASWK